MSENRDIAAGTGSSDTGEDSNPTIAQLCRNRGKSAVSVQAKLRKRRWTTLVHNGVVFPTPYKRHKVAVIYNKKPIRLNRKQEELATMYAKMLHSDYIKNSLFNENFWRDWKKTLGEGHKIKNLMGCDFSQIYEWHQKQKKDKRETRKADKERLEVEYGWATIDGVQQKVGNFKIEPPGLFRGRGEHPNLGKVKYRIRPKDVTINIGMEAPVPVPNSLIGRTRSWIVQHDRNVLWLARWKDQISKENKYVTLGAGSQLKGEIDRCKYDKARELKGRINNIESTFARDIAKATGTIRQIALAAFVIKELALRPGNKKDKDRSATVGCCTMKVKNVVVMNENRLKFDFLGKGSVRCQKELLVEDIVVCEAFEELQIGKSMDDNLFDNLNANKLNAYLKTLMPGLTAKVFRTFKACSTFQDMLAGKIYGDGATEGEKLLDYRRANQEVAKILNHRRLVKASEDGELESLEEAIKRLKREVERGEALLQNMSRKVAGLQRSIIDDTTRDLRDKEKKFLNVLALGTSRTNYLDPRISVAWSKTNGVNIRKIFNKSQLEKFAWALEEEADFIF